MTIQLNRKYIFKTFHKVFVDEQVFSIWPYFQVKLQVNSNQCKSTFHNFSSTYCPVCMLFSYFRNTKQSFEKTTTILLNNYFNISLNILDKLRSITNANKYGKITLLYISFIFSYYSLNTIYLVYENIVYIYNFISDFLTFFQKGCNLTEWSF